MYSLLHHVSISNTLRPRSRVYIQHISAFLSSMFPCIYIQHVPLRFASLLLLLALLLLLLAFSSVTTSVVCVWWSTVSLPNQKNSLLTPLTLFVCFTCVLLHLCCSSICSRLDLFLLLSFPPPIISVVCDRVSRINNKK